LCFFFPEMRSFYFFNKILGLGLKQAVKPNIFLDQLVQFRPLLLFSIAFSLASCEGVAMWFPFPRRLRSKPLTNADPNSFFVCIVAEYFASSASQSLVGYLLSSPFSLPSIFLCVEFSSLWFFHPFLSYMPRCTLFLPSFLFSGLKFFPFFSLKCTISKWYSTEYVVYLDAYCCLLKFIALAESFSTFDIVEKSGPFWKFGRMLI
jgi:hypothetical protein